MISWTPFPLLLLALRSQALQHILEDLQQFVIQNEPDVLHGVVEPVPPEYFVRPILQALTSLVCHALRGYD